MRSTCLALSLAAILWFPVVEASKIVCLDKDLDTRQWVEKYLALADVVMLGKVVSAKGPETPGSGASTEGMTLEQKYRRIASESVQIVSLEPVRIWKGPPLEILTAQNNTLHAQYGFPLQVGETYLVFAYRQKDGDGYLISTVCAATKREAPATERIRVLDELAVASEPPGHPAN